MARARAVSVPTVCSQVGGLIGRALRRRLRWREQEALESLITGRVDFLVGLRVPRTTPRLLPEKRNDRRHVIAVLSESCLACESLVTSLERAELEVDATRLTVVLRGGSLESSLAIRVLQLSSRVVVDQNGAVSSALCALLTPTILAVDLRTRRVVKGVAGGNADWVHGALRRDWET